MPPDPPTFLEGKLALFRRYQRARTVARLCFVGAVVSLAVARSLSAIENGDPEWLPWGLAGGGFAVLGLSLTLMRRRWGRELSLSGAASSPLDRGKTTAGASQPAAEPGTEPTSIAWLSFRVELDEPWTIQSNDGTTDSEIILPRGPLNTQSRVLECRQVEGDAIHYLRIETQVEDSQGRWWSAETWLDPDALLTPLAPDGSGVCLWQDAPRAWHAILDDSRWASGIEALLDSRERYALDLGDRAIVMMLKYQGPYIDVGWWSEGGRLVVRTARMYYEDWEADGSGEEKFVELVDEVTFGFPLDPQHVLLPTAPEFHYREWNQWYDEPPLAERRPRFQPVQPGD